MTDSIQYQAEIEQASGSPRMGTQVWHQVLDGAQAGRIAERLGFGSVENIGTDEDPCWLVGVDSDRAEDIEETIMGDEYVIQDELSFRIRIEAP
jgi:hypothetical protein